MRSRAERSSSWRSASPLSRRCWNATNPAVTIAVTSDTNATLTNIVMPPMNRPPPVDGTTSPYPTVVTVCAAHQNSSPQVANAFGLRKWTTTAAAVITPSIIRTRYGTIFPETTARLSHDITLSLTSRTCCHVSAQVSSPPGLICYGGTQIFHTQSTQARSEHMAKTIGIDLGTTNSCMAVLEGSEPTVIPNAEGGRTTPSVVAFGRDGQRLVGAPAKRQQVTNPQNTIFSIKRFMGRKYDEVSEEMKIVPYEVVQGPNDDVRVKAEGTEYAPPEISAMILQKLKADAESYLGETVTDAVVTVPAYFNNAQRE